MIVFTVQLTQPAIRDIDPLSESVHSTIIEGIASLRKDPFPSPPLKKRLKGLAFPLHRLRIGDYRLLYRIDEKTITIMRVVNRKDLERGLKNLKR